MNIDVTPTHGYPHMYDFIGNTAGASSNPVVLIVLTIVILLYYILFSYLGVSAPRVDAGVGPSTGITVLETFMWGLFIFLVLINGLQYFFGVDIKAGVKNLFSPIPEVDITVTSEGSGLADADADAGPITVPEITLEKQVFHIPDNKYTYDDANAVCQAYGGRLASYTEIADAYKMGGEWCGYGWSQGQLGLFPTQKATYDKLQKTPGHENDCGREGINGGYIANPNVRFGANCYGYKPVITSEEREAMADEMVVPLTPQEREFEKKVRYYRGNLPDIMVSPFNYSRWSQI